VAVQVTEVLEAVPGQLDGEMTQPVDLPATNPFASDEPTETALLDAPSLARVVGGELNEAEIPESSATQPMRPQRTAASKPGHAEPGDPAKASAADGSETTLDVEPIPADLPGTASPASPSPAAPPSSASSAAASPAAPASAQEPGGAAATGNPPAGTAPAPAPAPADPADPSDGADSDATPVEIAIADTGRAIVPALPPDLMDKPEPHDAPEPHGAAERPDKPDQHDHRDHKHAKRDKKHDAG
jgi:hypothetical protein